jgi:hypothetical protein
MKLPLVDHSTSQSEQDRLLRHARTTGTRLWTPLPREGTDGKLRGMRKRHRKARRRRRFDDLVLDLRTARWLGTRLWRPTLTQIASRRMRLRRRRRRRFAH